MSSINPSGTGATGRTPEPTTGSTPRTASTTSGVRAPSDRKDLTQAQKEQFGGMKFGASFFGWLTATGTLVVLSALLTAAGAAVGQAQNLNLGQSNQATGAGLVGAIVLLVVILVSYFAGGYVAGRMARFNGLKQGLGVFLWALILTAVFAVLIAVAGTRFDLLSRLNLTAPIPMTSTTFTIGAVIGAVTVLVVTLVGSLLGGLAGMRFHRRVDRVEVYES